jgi:hypothetical protein
VGGSWRFSQAGIDSWIKQPSMEEREASQAPKPQQGSLFDDDGEYA